MRLKRALRNSKDKSSTVYVISLSSAPSTPFYYLRYFNVLAVPLSTPFLYFSEIICGSLTVRGSFAVQSEDHLRCLQTDSASTQDQLARILTSLLATFLVPRTQCGRYASVRNLRGFQDNDAATQRGSKINLPSQDFTNKCNEL